MRVVPVGKQSLQLSVPLEIVVQHRRVFLQELGPNCHDLEKLEEPVAILCIGEIAQIIHGESSSQVLDERHQPPRQPPLHLNVGGFLR